jgi:hypothetical protein
VFLRPIVQLGCLDFIGTSQAKIMYAAKVRSNISERCCFEHGFSSYSATVPNILHTTRSLAYWTNTSVQMIAILNTHTPRHRDVISGRLTFNPGGSHTDDEAKKEDEVTKTFQKDVVVGIEHSEVIQV